MRLFVYIEGGNTYEIYNCIRYKLYTYTMYTMLDGRFPNSAWVTGSCLATSSFTHAGTLVPVRAVV